MSETQHPSLLRELHPLLARWQTPGPGDASPHGRLHHSHFLRRPPEARILRQLPVPFFPLQASALPGRGHSQRQLPTDSFPPHDGRERGGGGKEPLHPRSDSCLVSSRPPETVRLNLASGLHCLRGRSHGCQAKRRRGEIGNGAPSSGHFRHVKSTRLLCSSSPGWEGAIVSSALNFVLGEKQRH